MENEAEREIYCRRLRAGRTGTSHADAVRTCGKKNTQKEVAEAIGISQSYISRLEKDHPKLRKKLEEADQPSVHTT
ncbi:MAG: helix-turn-helix domain-containing protein [Ruminococcus callidus]